MNVLRPLSAAPLLLALAACAPGDEPAAAPLAPPSADTPSTAAPTAAARPLPESAYDREIVEHARAEEAPRLPADGAGGVRRTGWDRLEITAGDGSRNVFADTMEAGHVMWVHLYGGRLDPLDAHVVEKRLVPEGWEVVVVDGATGRRTLVDVPPVAAPDGQRFVTASQDLVAGYIPNRIRVYRVEQGRPVLEWEHEPRTWGAHQPVWEDARTISLAWGVLTEDWQVEEQPAPLYLELTPGGWAFRGGTPPERER